MSLYPDNRADGPLPSDKKNDDSHEGITVAIRMRPLNQVEGNKHRVWKVLPQYSSITQTTNAGKLLAERVTGRNFFTFDKTFGEDANTKQVYHDCAKGIVSSVVNGLNGTIFAYGQTSSGKTYTMQGSGSIEEGSHSEGGIVHMAAKDIFSHIQSQRNRMFLVRASFLEIYNEEVRDLLSNSNKLLQIREDPRRGVFVKSVEEMVTDFESLLRILFHGEKSRAVASTGMNERSSRSHTIFRVTIESREKGRAEDSDTENDENRDPAGDGAVRVSTLNLVDLAGSESVRHTGATGERQKEGGMINQSLLTLSRVIVALGTPNQAHINFRDSKLTRILQPSLSGNARMAVICCATPSELYLEETRSTLQFASRAKLVKTNAQVNEILDDRSIIRRLQRELAEARRQSNVPGTEHLQALENQAATADTVALEAKAKLHRLKESILNAGYLFGNQNTAEVSSPGLDVSEAVDRLHESKKRRQSDGALFLGNTSPSKPDCYMATTPNTAPRKRKQKVPRQILSPSSELQIVREALSSRNNLTRTLERSVNEYIDILKAKDTELQKEVSQNESLQQERGESQILVSSLRQMIESIQSEFSKAMQAHERVLEEKESVINDSLQKLENGFREREKLSNANTNMEVQLLSARQENLSQVETSTALTNNLENLASENTVLKNGVDKSIVLISKLKGEKNALEEQLSTMSEKAEAFESINGQLTANKVGLEQSLAELLNKNEVSNGENARLNRRVSQLEGVMTELNRQWLAEKEKTAALVESTENFAKALAILKDEKNALGIEVEAAREELMRSKSEAENMALEASKLGNEAAATSVRLKEVEENADFLRKEKKACEAATAELRVDLETRETEFFGVSNSLKEARICITELEENNADLQQHITSLEKQIINLQAKKEAMSAESIKTSQELHSFRIEASEGLEAASREKTELEATVSILEQANYELTLRRQELEETNISLQAENIDVDGRLFALEANKSQLDSQLVTVESEIVLLLEEKDSQMSRLTDMQQQVTVLEEVRENMNSQMAELIVEKDSMILESETSYQNVQSSLKQVSKDLEMLRLEKVELEARLSELQEANGELTSSRQELQETLTSLQVENADVRDRLSAYVVEKAELDSQIMYIKSEVMEAVAEKDSKVVNLEAKLSDLQAENADVNDRLSTLQVEKAEIGSHLMSVKTEAIAMLATSDSRTATLSDMQQQVAVLEDQLADTEERIDSLHSEKESSSNKTKLQLEEAKGELSSLEAQKRELEIKLSSLDSCHQEIERSVLALQAENEDILVRLSTSEDERAGLEGQLEHLNFEFEELRAKNNSTEGGRQEFQNQLEMAERHLQQAEVDLQHAISQRESLTEILRERENERDDAMLELEKQYEKNRHLSRSFSDCLPKEKEAELISQISELKKTKSELTQLLVLSNESEVRSRNAAAAAENESNVKARELDDAMYRLSQVEEELRLSEMTDYDEKKTTEANSDFLDKIKLIEAEKAKVEDLLAKEKGESRSSEERLKKQMGEEQRILIKEAESRMLQLRSKCEDLESRLSQSETEAYVARQQVEEVRDQKKLVEERYLEVESTVASLNETISRHESQFSVLQSDLNKARAECYALKESTIEMKEKARRAMRESDKAARDSNMVSSEISVLRRKITSLERSNTQEREDNERLKMKIKTMKAEKTKAEEEHGAVADLKKEKESKNKQIKKLDESIYTLKQENETISRELRKLKSAIRTKGDTDGSAIEIGVLQGEIDRLIKQMKQKDQRIRKLEAVRLTKEQVESIKKMKADNLSYEKKCAKIADEKKSLQSQLSLIGSDLSLRTEASELRFDKEALESKLRKFAAHCQRLEDDKAGAIDALRSCDIDVEQEGDINDAIISLCDKLASKSGREFNAEIDRLQQDNKTLQARIERLTKADEVVAKKADGYQREIKDLKRTMTDKNDDVSGARSEMSRKLRFLEQENLQLMLDVKSTKKQLQTAREELEMLRMNVADSTTMDFNSVGLGGSGSVQKVCSTETSNNENKRPRTSADATPGRKRARASKAALVERTNQRDKESGTPGTKKQWVALDKNRTNVAAPGLGEAAIDGDNTGECKQS